MSIGSESLPRSLGSVTTAQLAQIKTALRYAWISENRPVKDAGFRNLL